MPESRLRTLSIEFAVEILKLVKQLKDRHETIVSNQIGRPEPVSVQISTTRNMHMESLISL